MQTIFWFRRDLRLKDNAALFFALSERHHVLPIFIFDKNILCNFESQDSRLTFIYDAVMNLRDDLRTRGCDLRIFFDTPKNVFKRLVKEYGMIALYLNEDYEPYAIARDRDVRVIVENNRGSYCAYKDHVIFSPIEIVKSDGTPYTIYTPYSRKWMALADEFMPHGGYDSLKCVKNFMKIKRRYPDITLEDMGLMRSQITVLPYRINEKFLRKYGQTRNYPYNESGTSRIGPYLRFGLVSIREIMRDVILCDDKTYLKELIWREFFQMIIYHFPETMIHPFKKSYEKIVWQNNTDDFNTWCTGMTGYPLVDAGMRELVATGYMHNRVRMVSASFLCKHLLIDWRWGEHFFAQHLLDYELASNVGNWQWVVGSGCDATPYFRVFNPELQKKKYDPKEEYVDKWIKELRTDLYPTPIVSHEDARERAIYVYKTALKK